jgi:purine-binding chemotaxis protein CheW
LNRLRPLFPRIHRRPTAAANPDHAEAASHLAGEFLIFRLCAEEYGVDILQVQEICSYEAPTSIANAPIFIKG